MKKRIFACTLVCLMIAALMAIPTGAIVGPEVWNDVKFSIFTQTQLGFNFAEYDTNGTLGNASKSMRGFAVSPDGAYVFGGYLHPAGSSAVEMFDGKTGKLAGTYVHTEADGSSISYPKGIVCDDRGYLYCGLASRTNKDFASIAVVKYDEKGSDGWLKEVSRNVFITVESGVKIGVNGVAVQQIGNNYYLYVVTNYDVDYIYRLDVTDPANPVVDTTFADSGRIDLSKAPFSVSDANYLDVDDDGTIYLGCNAEFGSGLMVISADGKSVQKTVSQKKGYGVELWEDYVLVTSQSGPTCICVYDKLTLNLIKTIELTTANVDATCDAFDFGGVNSLVNLYVANDVLYVGDQCSEGYDQIFMAPLTDIGRPIVEEYVKNIAARLKIEETTAAPVVTEKPAETTAEPKVEDTTAAPADDTTKAPIQDTAPVTTAATSSGGCGSSVAVAAVALTAVFGAAVVAKKRK